MSFFDIFGDKPIVFDGAMGTMLQAAGLEAGALTETMNTSSPEAVLAVHKAYINAGTSVITTNSFSTNASKLSPRGMDPFEEMTKAVLLAKQAAAESGKTVLVAADIGPTGKLMHPLGDFGFEEAVNAFAPSCAAAEKAGADFIFFETMSDLYECKAALIAARENSSLPVAISLTFDESGRILTGADAKTVSIYLSSLGVDALGVNCGLGPDLMEPIAITLARESGLPVIVNANAGLPRLNENGETVFDVPPQRFYSFARTLNENGIAAIGGCCGTSPEYIKNVSDALIGRKRITLPRKSTPAVCSGTKCFVLGESTAVIGERLNPTGKPKLKAALKEGNMDYLCAEAVAQQSAGADILDLNVGLPEIDETAVLSKALLAVQKTTDLPLQLDSASPEALAAAARIYNGIPIINSISGKEEILDSVLPIVKKYGALSVALLLDDNGIPNEPQGRLAIAEKISARAEAAGVSRNRLLFDALTMTVATDSESGNKTLECVKNLTENGLMTALGVSNISFGMPDRERINASFLGAAISRGLTAAIINPSSETARTVLSDPNPDPVFRFDTASDISLEIKTEKKETTLFDAVYFGLSAKAAECAKTLLETEKPLEIIENRLIPALNALGDGYESKQIFLPRLLGGAEAAKAAFAVINNALSDSSREKGMKVIMATVKGDIHDIGKNIVSTLLSNYGFDVIDLGKDVPPERVLEATLTENAKLVGLSALMTTTVPAMADTVKLLKQKAPNVKIVVGGAVLTEEYAKNMNADLYAPDAMTTVKYALSIKN